MDSLGRSPDIPDASTIAPARDDRSSNFVWKVLLGVSLLAAISVLCGPPGDSHQAQATPPIVRSSGHPFDKDWLEVFWTIRAKCNGCHRPNTERHDFSSYDALMSPGPEGSDPLIVPGDPENSPLYEYVVWNHAADPRCTDPDEPMMPPDNKLDWLSAGQLQTLHRWIANGALEYALPQTCNIRPLLETDFVSAKECGQCHPKHFDDWSRSMHAYAQHSPAFEAFTLTMIERTDGTVGTFCTRCHTPIGVALGETGSTRNIHRSRISMEGVTCVVCHRLSQPYYKASGRLPVVPGQVRDGCLFGPFQDPVNPDGSTHNSHARAGLMSADFCGSCHDVTNPQGVRLEEAFSEWQNSPAADQGIACQHCHMGPNPGVPVPRDKRPWGKIAVVPGVDPSCLPDRPISDHSFVGPDYSLLPDTEFPHKLDWMYETDYRNQQCLTPYQRESLTVLRIRNRQQLARATQLRHQLLRNAAKIAVTHDELARAGDKVKVRVDVKSTTLGHNLPTGFTAERQVWVEVKVTDPRGRVVFHSGDLDHNHDLRDEHSHDVELGELAYDRHLLNFQSKFTALTAQGTERTVIIPVNRHLSPITFFRPANTAAQSFGRPDVFRVAKSSLPPGQIAGHTYPVHLDDCRGDYAVHVRLNYRHLPPALFDKIGIPHLKHLLEIVVIDEYHGVIHVN
ncbi:MAG: hypothetical protein KDA80_03535 [Planctomycetaceae bacterium]|nr:hypothetical protein [Planctomycetaceae bacterium]